MKKLSWIAIVLFALGATGCSGRFYNSETPANPRYDVSDFNGEWHLVDHRSDHGHDWRTERRDFNDDSWGATTVRYRGWFLPDEFRISGDRQELRIEDTGGGLISEIALNDDYRLGTYNNNDRDYDANDYNVRARWLSDRRFQVERGGPYSRHITQIFTLGRRDRQLIIQTDVFRDGTTRSYTRVYDRV